MSQKTLLGICINAMYGGFGFTEYYMNRDETLLKKKVHSALAQHLLITLKLVHVCHHSDVKQPQTNKTINKTTNP